MRNEEINNDQMQNRDNQTYSFIQKTFFPKNSVKLELDSMKIKKNIYERLNTVFININSYIGKELDKSLINFEKIDKNNFNYEKIKTLVLDNVVYR